MLNYMFSIGTTFSLFSCGVLSSTDEEETKADSTSNNTEENSESTKDEINEKYLGLFDDEYKGELKFEEFDSENVEPQLNFGENSSGKIIHIRNSNTNTFFYEYRDSGFLFSARSTLNQGNIPVTKIFSFPTLRFLQNNDMFIDALSLQANPNILNGGYSALDTLVIPAELFLDEENRPTYYIYELFGGVDSIPSSLKTLYIIGEGTVSSKMCNNLNTIETIQVSTGIDGVQDGAFKGCTNLKTLILPNSAKRR